MKFKSLTVQIWLVFCLTITIPLLLTLLLMPRALNYYFIDEIYANIEETQNFIIQNNLEENFPDFSAKQLSEKSFRMREVQHIFIFKQPYKTALTIPVSENFLETVKNEAFAQDSHLKRYSKFIIGEQVFYVIRKTPFGYLISYIGDTYRENMIKRHFTITGFIIIVVFLLSLIPSIAIASFMAKPLVNLKESVKKIANKNWSEPIYANRKDEIGQLANSIEQMRQKLIRQDKAQQSFFQNVSHELKTPIMVIQSYAQAIIDGIYPKGNLESSIDTIKFETSRLEKLVQKILLLSKLDYLDAHEEVFREVRLAKIIQEVSERLRYIKPHINIELDLEPVSVYCSPEQLNIVLENILDNQLRYAKEQICITMSQTFSSGNNIFLLLKFWNDGVPLKEAQLETIFEKFSKGPKGEHGLGLAIVQKIVQRHQGIVWAQNENNGVAFYLQFPIDKKTE